jgi:hypothetical protein
MLLLLNIKKKLIPVNFDGSYYTCENTIRMKLMSGCQSDEAKGSHKGKPGARSANMARYCGGHVKETRNKYGTSGGKPEG